VAQNRKEIEAVFSFQGQTVHVDERCLRTSDSIRFEFDIQNSIFFGLFLDIRIRMFLSNTNRTFS
jgi:hypothetical protein